MTPIELHRRRQDHRKQKHRFDKPGQLMLWRIINPPNDGQRFPVNDLLHAVELYKALTASDLLDVAISSNVYGLEIYEGGEWNEWESDACDGISELSDSEYGDELRVQNLIHLEKYPRP